MVYRKGQFGLMQFLIFILPLILFIGFFYYGFTKGVNFELPANMKQVAITGLGSDILTVIGIPQDWQFFPGLVYVLFVPFLFITIITFGFLRELNIFTFGGPINIILALLVAFSTIPFGIFVKAVAAILATMGLYGALAFGGMFILGVAYVFMKKTGEWGYLPGDTKHTYRGLKLHSRYRVLVNYLHDVADDNPTQVALVNDITTNLTNAETDWVAGNNEGAVQKLESSARKAYRDAKNKPRRRP